MEIKREEIENDIKELIARIKKTLYVEDYKYLKCNLMLLLDLYRLLYGEEYKCDIPKSTLLEYLIRSEDKSVGQLYYEEYTSNRILHDRVADTIFRTISKYHLPKQMIQERINPKEFYEIVDSFFYDYGGGTKEVFEQLKKKEHIAVQPYSYINNSVICLP